MSTTAQPQQVYALTRREFGEFCADEGSYSIVSMHGSLASANTAARALANVERPGRDDLDGFEYQEDYDQYGAMSISWSYDDWGQPGMEIQVERWELKDATAEMDNTRPVTQLHSNHIEHVYALTRRDFGEFNANEGDLSLVSMHNTVESANVAAKAIADAEVDDQDELNFEQDHDEHGAVSFSWRYDDEYGEPGAEIRVKKWDLQCLGSEVNLPRPGRQVMGNATPIPTGRPLLRGAKFVIRGDLQSMSNESAKRAIKTYNGKVVDWPNEADYVVVGTVPGAPDFSWIHDFGAERIDEATLLAFIEQGIPPHKILRSDEVQEVPGPTSSSVARPPLAEIRSQVPRTSHDVQALARLGGAGQENGCGPPAKRLKM